MNVLLDRETFGGLHKKYAVEPDMMMLKTLGNGYAITAVLGKYEIMKAAESTFISSTFWTERIGPTAALKTLEVMERLKSWEKISKIGLKISKRLANVARKYEIKLELSGLPALISFSIKANDWVNTKHTYTEMLKKGILSSNSIILALNIVKKFRTIFL